MLPKAAPVYVQVFTLGRAGGRGVVDLDENTAMLALWPTHQLLVRPQGEPMQDAYWQSMVETIHGQETRVAAAWWESEDPTKKFLAAVVALHPSLADIQGAPIRLPLRTRTLDVRAWVRGVASADEAKRLAEKALETLYAKGGVGLGMSYTELGRAIGAGAMRTGPLHTTCQSTYTETGGLEHFCGRAPGHEVASASIEDTTRLHDDLDGFYWDDDKNVFRPGGY